MKSFLDFLNEKKTQGTYCSLRVSDEDCKRLYQFCDNLGIPNLEPEKDYHITVLYSKTRVNVNPSQFKLPSPITVSRWHVFDNEKRPLVLKIKSKEIDEIHKRLIDMGGTHDYPSFQAHITVAYNYPMKPVPDTVPDFKISFGKFETKPIEE